MPMTAQTEICPNCGQSVSNLDEYTGWCADCSGDVGTTCHTCGGPNDGQRICRKCRFNQWLERNGDAIDVCLAEGLSFTVAVDVVRKFNAKEEEENSRCLICNTSIPVARNGTALFCSTNDVCKTAKNRLKRFVYVKGIDRETALKEVVILARAELYANRLSSVEVSGIDEEAEGTSNEGGTVIPIRLPERSREWRRPA